MLRVSRVGVGVGVGGVSFKSKVSLRLFFTRLPEKTNALLPVLLPSQTYDFFSHFDPVLNLLRQYDDLLSRVDRQLGGGEASSIHGEVVIGCQLGSCGSLEELGGEFCRGCNIRG